MITVRCFTSFEDAAFLRGEIDALNAVSARPDPFSTFAFLQNFFRHDEFHPAGRGLRLWFLAAFSADRLVGYLALRRVPQRVLGIRTATVGFLATRDTDRPQLVARPEDAPAVGAAFYAWLLDHRSEWSCLEFHQQDAASALFPPPAGVSLEGLLVREWPTLENGTVHLRWQTAQDYFNALSKKFHSNLGRQMRNLLAAGRVELLASSDPVATPALLDLYRGIEPRSWKADLSARIGRHPKRIEYVQGLLDPAQPMRVSIRILLLDGIPVAGLVAGTFLRGFYALHMCYDERLHRCAPGSALLVLALREAIDGGCAFLNMGSGFGYFKARWLAQITETRVLQIYRPGSPLYWRRRLGDWKRRFLAAPAKAAAPLFNPGRREASARDAEPAATGAIAELRMDTREREHIAALIATVRAAGGQLVSGAELAALMPGHALLSPARRPAVAPCAATASRSQRC